MLTKRQECTYHQELFLRGTHLVNMDLLPFRFTSVYKADAIVASGVLPWHIMCCLSSANLPPHIMTIIELYLMGIDP